MSEAVIGCCLGVLLGMRHAVEPDHLAAVTTLSLRRPGPRRGMLLGALWGLGHTLALLGLGGALLLLERQLRPAQAALLEGGVGVMLVVLGVLALRRALREESLGPVRIHRHLGETHYQPTTGPHLPRRGWALTTQPLLVGFAHGLAGSGVLTAVALGAMPTMGGRLLYIVMFGVGSALGMALLSGALGVSLARSAARPRLHRLLTVGAAAASIVLGTYWVYAAAGLIQS